MLRKPRQTKEQRERFLVEAVNNAAYNLISAQAALMGEKISAQEVHLHVGKLIILSNVTVLEIVAERKQKEEIT